MAAVEPLIESLPDGSFVTAGGASIVVEPLTDEEAALYCILSDPSGLDLAEFSWVDERNEDGCWRAWPFQWPWWRCEDERQVDLAARSVGKSESIMARAAAFVFCFPGQEMLLTAPEGIHLDAITDRIEGKYQDVRLMREMLVVGRGGINHRPFKATFSNGTLVRGRIPQATGVGVKGQHPVRLEMDEAQDYPAQGWKELRPTVNWAAPGAQWRIHGVTKGVQDDFFEVTQDGSGFTIHKITAMHRPGWTAEEREAAIREYGSPNDPDYRRNILGEHGDATNAIFVFHKFMRCVDQVEGSDYNVDEYHEKLITIEAIEDRVTRRRERVSNLNAMATAAIELMDLSPAHKRYQVTWGGADIGVTKDPTEILLCCEYKPDAAERKAFEKVGIGNPPAGMTRIKLLTRIQLKRCDIPLQAELIMHLIDFYRPKAFSIDKTGLGIGLLQALQRRAGIELADLAEQMGLEEDDLARLRDIADTEDEDLGEIDEETRAMARRALTTIKGYNFSEKVLVEIDAEEAAKLGPNAKREDIIDKAGIKRQVLEYATDRIREIVDDSRLLLPLSKEIINQFNGQTWSYSAGTMDRYGKRRKVFSIGHFHMLDAMRMLVLGMVQQGIEILTASPAKPQKPVVARFGL